MKPADKERLVRSRPTLVNSLDVTTVLPLLKKPGMFTDDDEARILADPRRRERVIMFLNAMEKKNTETFQAFCDVLEELFPHIFLLLTDWDQDDDLVGSQANRDGLDDAWAVVHRSREYLVSEIDAAKVVPYLREKQVFTEEQERTIRDDPVRERRTETFLDMLEMKPSEDYAIFLEVIGDIYPHVYLELSGDDSLADL